MIEQPEDVSTRMTYDIYGNIISANQFGGSTYRLDSTQRWSYDSRLRICKHYVPETGSKLYEYNNLNQVVAYGEGLARSISCGSSIPSASRVSLTYYPRGETKTINYPGTTPDITMYYDKSGNLTRNERGISTWSYQYDSADNLTEEKLSIDGGSYTARYTYNAIGAKETYLSPSGHRVNYSPNGLGQPTGIAYAANGRALVSDVLYHPNGALRYFNNASGASNRFDQNERLLTSRIRGDVGSKKLVDFAYKYDANSNVTEMNNYAFAGENRSMTYDDLGRLKTARGPWGTGTFKYDVLGNLIEKRLGSRSVRMLFNDSNNQLVQVSDSAPSQPGGGLQSYRYDTRGNATSIGGNAGMVLSYDAANQPTTMTGGSTGNFVYDGNFKRVRQTIDGKTIYSFYSRSGELLLRDEPGNRADRSIYHSLSGVPVVRIKGEGASYKENYLYANHLGSTEVATDHLGNIKWRESHTPFGEKRFNPDQNRDDMGFTGHIEDSTGLVYMQSRYYNPVAGRFLSNDPVDFLGHLERGNTQGFNRYAYAYNNPYKYTDPDGELPIVPIVVAGARACASNAACRGAVVKATKNVADKLRKTAQRKARNERRERRSREKNGQNQKGNNKERFEGKQNAKKQSGGKQEKSSSRQGSDTKTQRGRNNQKRDDSKTTNATEKQAGNRGSRDPNDKF